MDLVLLEEHVLVVLDGLVAQLHEHVAVQHLLRLYLPQPLLDLPRPLLVYAPYYVVRSLLLDPEVSRELELCHLLDLQSTHHSDYLEQSLLAPLHGLLYAQLLPPDPALEIGLEFLEQRLEEVAVVAAFVEEAVVLGGYLLEGTDEALVELLLQLLAGHCAYEVGEYQIGAPETDGLHEFQEFF